MAIKTSGPISIQDIVNEFGGTAPHSLNEYYKGGTYVPVAPQNANVPTQGAISLENFYGASKIIYITYEMWGAGGTGGRGYENQGAPSGSRAGAGKPTGVMTRSRYDALVAAGSDFNSLSSSDFVIYAQGGAGGLNGNLGSPYNGSAGEASDFGAGGAGGSPNSAGSNPTWGHWGAAGGGGGGDNGSTSYLNLYGKDAAGAAGSGGLAAAKTTGTSAIDPGQYVLFVGGAGPQYSGGNHDGGFGMPGYLKFSLSSTPLAGNYILAPSNESQNRQTSYITFMTIQNNGSVVFPTS